MIYRQDHSTTGDAQHPLRRLNCRTARRQHYLSGSTQSFRAWLKDNYEQLKRKCANPYPTSNLRRKIGHLRHSSASY